MLLSVGIAKIVFFHDMVLTYVDQLFGVLAWSWTLNKSRSLSGVEQTLFLDQALIQLLSGRNGGLKFGCSAVLDLENLAKLEISVATMIGISCSQIFVKQLKLSQI